jgi:hypothetical protein
MVPTKRVDQIQPNGQGGHDELGGLVRTTHAATRARGVRWRRRAAGSLKPVWCRFAG